MWYGWMQEKIKTHTKKQHFFWRIFQLKLLQMTENGRFFFSLTSPNQRRRQLFCCWNSVWRWKLVLVLKFWTLFCVFLTSECLMFSCRAMLCILNLAVSTNHHMLPPFCRHRVRHACMYVSRLTLFFSPLLFLSVVVSFHNFHIRECVAVPFRLDIYTCRCYTCRWPALLCRCEMVGPWKWHGVAWC